ncbi:MAG TPA: hypothetical protein VFE17_06895 [Candidatus Baltobacteraceae bacterium]|nr:hypothetical protein [Candidatus Baltobacteraceae bacterium]
MAVGTARIGQDGTVGVNVVTTLRQANGLTAVLADTPTLTGPSGFTVPPGTPGAYTGIAPVGNNVDAGTSHISGSPQVPLNNTNLVNSTLGTFTGVFSYGFGPFNCDQDCTNISAYYPGNPNGTGGNGFSSSIYDGSSLIAAVTRSGDPTQPQPFFSADPFDYLIGPPAVPFFNNGTFPTGFAGYSPGFTVFELPPVSGQYSLAVNVPAKNTSPVTYNASATLNAGTVLPATTVAVTGETANGGLSGTVSVPAGVTETEVFVVDATAGTYFTVGPLSGTGTVSWALPGNLGPCNGNNCQSGASATPTLNGGDSYFVAAVGYDYPAFEAGPPGNTQQKPTIAGANGQADLTMSPIVPGTY